LRDRVGEGYLTLELGELHRDNDDHDSAQDALRRGLLASAGLCRRDLTVAEHLRPSAIIPERRRSAGQRVSGSAVEDGQVDFSDAAGILDYVDRSDLCVGDRERHQ
jgi:hypothetical protein